MRKVKKKNVFDKIKYSINDTIDSAKKKTRRNTRDEANDTVKKKTGVKKKTNTKKKVNSGKKKRSLWKKILTVILIIGICCILLVTLFFGYIVISAPKFSESAFAVKDQTVVYDINGDVITTLGAEKRESVSYDELPQVLIDAIIATEDSRFFQHNGVDLPRFLKASVLQVVGIDGGGASTITMQTVKNNLTSTESRGIKGIIRKFQDVYLSVFKVEKQYSKEEIIELYVNNYNLGDNIYGVSEAAKYYFGKSISELTLPEASLIAGLFQAPNGHNPYRHIDSATSRRNTVLELMVRHGYITKEVAELAKKVKIEDLLAGKTEATPYQGYIDAVIDEVEKKTKNNPYKVPMKIYTTMERSIQDGINTVLNNSEWYWRDDKVQSGIAVVNVQTGAISAIGAGRNRSGERTFNYATDAKRQPGSTAKPIFDYGPGIEYNNFSSYTLFNDEPWTYTNGPSVNNWDMQFHGLVTTRYALQYSRNVPALKAFQQVGPKNSQKFAYSLGLDVSLNKNSENYRQLKGGGDNAINEAYSIGGVAEGFTPLEMAAAYSGFASGGYYSEPYSVTKIEYRDTGEVEEFKPEKERVMKESTAYIMNNILESAVTSGFAGGASVAGSHVAAKTGTSNFSDDALKKYKLPSYAVNDLWTVAYTSQYSVAVWYGYESAEIGYNINGGGHKEAVTSAVMKYIPKDTKGWTMPSSVVASQVEKETVPAKLPSANTPSNMILTEYFVKGTQPTEVSERYQTLDDVTGLDAKTSGNNATLSWDYETPTVLTDAYLNKYFSQSTFGHSTNNFISARKNYNNNTLGTLGFGIYKVENDGTLTLVGFTTNKTYTYTGAGDTTLVVKAEHSKFKTNASKGSKVTFSLSGGGAGVILAMLDGGLSVEANAGNYIEAGFKYIYYGTQDITNSANITYKILDNNSELGEYSSKTEFVNKMNSLTRGKYRVKYIISYGGKEDTKTRMITLK